MCIYCGTKHYRKIYENHYGPIARDEDGRSYEIHHIDGDRENNDPNNLLCVSIKEHYAIHESQGDWAACLYIKGQRMDYTPDELSNLASRAAQKRVHDGKHHFLGESNPSHDRVREGNHNWQGNGADQRDLQLRRVAEGSHNFLGGEIQRNLAKKRLTDGSHHFLGGKLQRTLAKQRLDKGSHNFIQPWACEHCGKEGKGLHHYRKWHGDNCKSKK